MDYYLTSTICLNGHVVTDSTERGFGTPFCDECGAKTITACPNCNANIRGYYHVDGVISLGSRNPQAKPYCHACGCAYPWTEAKLAGLRELADAMDELTSNERALLAELMPHMMEETPRTPAAGFKISAIVRRIGGPAREVLRDAIISIAVDAGKKAAGF